MRLHNIVEDRVTDVTNRLMRDDQEFCPCDRCKMDVIALALGQVHRNM